MWDEDSVVHPKESEWFFVFNDVRQLVDIYDTYQFVMDTIGLKTLHDQGKMFFYHGPGDHMHLTDAYIDDYLIPLLIDSPNPTPTQH